MANKQSMYAKVREAMKALGLYETQIFTVAELDTIAKKAGVKRLDVMYVARYARRG